MRIWFRVGMEADVTEEELNMLQDGSCCDSHELMKDVIQRADLSGETYILGKENGFDIEGYDNPEKEIDFLF